MHKISLYACENFQIISIRNFSACCLFNWIIIIIILPDFFQNLIYPAATELRLVKFLKKH